MRKKIQSEKEWANIPAIQSVIGQEWSVVTMLSKKVFKTSQD